MSIAVFRIARMAVPLAAALAVPMAAAKLPPPSDEAKAKAAEAATKAAWGNKVANYQLCKSMDRAAARYFADMKAKGKEVKPAPELPACADPGPFVAAPAAAAPAPSAPAKKS